MGRPLSVLVIEDSEDDAQLMIRELERAGFEADWRRVETAEALRAALPERPWDICFADYSLPSFGAPEALDIVHAALPLLPFIVVSGVIGVDRAVGLMRAGADDYFLKGHLERLGLAVTRVVDSATALGRSEARLGTILLWMSDGVVTTDADGVIAFFNIGAERIFGLSAGQVIGTPVGRLIPELIAGVRAMPEGRLGPSRTSGDTPVPTRLVGHRATGEEFPIEATISRVEVSGEVVATVVLRDLSEREQAAARLRDSEARFASYFQSNPLASAIQRRRDNRIIDANDAATDLLGYARAELLGLDPFQGGLFADDSAARASLAGASAAGSRGREIELRTRSGDTLRVMLFVRPVVVADEQCLLIVAADLAERDRGASLERERDRLEQAAIAKSAFIASMSHELRTPLNAILGFSKLLLEQVDFTTKHRRYLEHVYDAGGHLLALISDVLDIARVEAGKTELHLEPIGLSGLLEPASAAARLSAEAKGLTFVAECEDGVILLIDAVRVREIVQNLLSNAVKFTVSGGRVALRAQSEGDALIIEVADSGVGIPLNSHGRVFQAFERLHEGVVAEPGTGLGLALTKKLVELQGGTIAFQSVPQVGTTFRVALPGVVTLAPPERSLTPGAEPTAAPVAGPIRILIVDDQTMMADLLRANLERCPDIEVLGVADTAAEGVEKTRTLEPAVVVMDFELPDGTGAEAAAAIHALNPSCAVIVLSSASERDAVESSIQAGAVAYLPKSEPADLLLDVIRRAAAGELLLPPVLFRKVARKVKADGARRYSFHGIEQKILDLACTGLDAAAISVILGLSAREFRVQWQSVMAKVWRSDPTRVATRVPDRVS